MFTLKEHLTFDQAKMVTEAVDNGKGGKNLFMEGIFVQGNKQNQNQRIYPVKEITKAGRERNDDSGPCCNQRGGARV